MAAWTSGPPFDCILMDMHMPKVDGLEAPRWIRAWEASQSVASCPIVAALALLSLRGAAS